MTVKGISEREVAADVLADGWRGELGVVAHLVDFRAAAGEDVAEVAYAGAVLHDPARANDRQHGVVEDAGAVQVRDADRNVRHAG